MLHFSLFSVPKSLVMVVEETVNEIVQSLVLSHSNILFISLISLIKTNNYLPLTLISL